MSEKSHKKRLDAAVIKQRPTLTRNQAQELIKQGHVTVDGKVITKPGAQVASNTIITLTQTSPKFVSRAGLKLEAALEHFDINVTNMVVLDAGLSTGGFTDCLLQRGVKHIYGVDVGHSQVSEKIRGDKRLTVMEDINLRDLENLPEKVNLVTLDLSFISVLKVMPAVVNLIGSNAYVIVLIKPQFEADRTAISSSGVVSDPIAHTLVKEKIMHGMAKFGFECLGIIDSPIVGATSGNKEFLGLFKLQN